MNKVSSVVKEEDLSFFCRMNVWVCEQLSVLQCIRRSRSDADPSLDAYHGGIETGIKMLQDKLLRKDFGDNLK